MTVWDMNNQTWIPLAKWMRYCPWINTPRWTNDQWEEAFK